jgi:hypothetical protein
MKLPVVSGSDAVKAFRKVGYEFDAPTHRTDAFPFPTIKNWPKEPFGR